MFEVFPCEQVSSCAGELMSRCGEEVSRADEQVSGELMSRCHQVRKCQMSR